MRLSELIHELDRLLECNGDIDVEVRNEAGEYDIAEVVEKVNIARERGMVTWRVFIDA